MNYFGRFIIVFTALCLLLTLQPLQAADSNKPAKLFEDISEWHVILAGPWRHIQRNVKKDDRYPAQLTYPGTDGQTRTIAIQVSPRGITRRLEVCKFPPLKIHFDKQVVKGTQWRGNTSLKLVTYCQTGARFEQYYIKEYLAYRIYNLITPYSFRVKPLSVEYRDSGSKSKPVTRFSFLIEDIDEVANRNDLDKLTIGEVPYKQLDAVVSSYLSLFQYMIGNLDWAATSGPDKSRCCHNSRVIGQGKDIIPKYVVPYDFDFSGLVNAPYALPPDGLRVRKVTQRLYRGFCVHNDSLPLAVATFNEKKSAIMTLFRDDPHLDNRSRDRALKFLEGFYQVINNPKAFKHEIIDKCRGSRPRS